MLKFYFTECDKFNDMLKVSDRILTKCYLVCFKPLFLTYIMLPQGIYNKGSKLGDSALNNVAEYSSLSRGQEEIHVFLARDCKDIWAHSSRLSQVPTFTNGPLIALKSSSSTQATQVVVAALSYRIVRGLSQCF